MAVYLFATIDREGRVEFDEVPSAQFDVYLESLQFAELVEYDSVLLRAGEKDRQKARMSSDLKRRWLELRRDSTSA